MTVASLKLWQLVALILVILVVAMVALKFIIRDNIVGADGTPTGQTVKPSFFKPLTA